MERVITFFTCSVSCKCGADICLRYRYGRTCVCKRERERERERKIESVVAWATETAKHKAIRYIVCIPCTYIPMQKALMCSSTLLLSGIQWMCVRVCERMFKDTVVIGICVNLVSIKLDKLFVVVVCGIFAAIAFYLKTGLTTGHGK